MTTAQAIAISWHSGQTRRDGVTPYHTHLDRVAGRVAHAGADAVAAAWLHDIIENTSATAQDLRAADIPEPVIAAVQVLTRDKRTPYADYLAAVKANPLARLVKVADILDNLTDAPTDRQIAKYARALLVLHDA